MKEIKFNEYRKLSYIISTSLILITLLLSIFRGFNLSIDFTGGIVMEFKQSGEKIEAETLRSHLKEMRISDFSIVESLDVTIIKIGSKNAEGNFSFFTKRIKESILDKFTKTDIEFLKIDFVSPQIGGELRLKAVIAVFISLIAVLLYISLRFEFRYSIGAIIALLHDIILTIGFISLFQLSVDVSTIAAILTVVGYSINDSVVIFDRIRENFKISPKASPAEVIQSSLNATLSRTIITSLTTLIAISAIIFIGGEILRPFALIIFFGIIIGTLSSIFIAPSTLYGKKIN